MRNLLLGWLLLILVTGGTETAQSQNTEPPPADAQPSAEAPSPATPPAATPPVETPPADEAQPPDDLPGTEPADLRPGAEEPTLPEAPAGELPTVPPPVPRIEDLGPELEVVTDGTLEMGKVETPAYWALVQIVKNSSLEDLEKNATLIQDRAADAPKPEDKVITFNDLMRHPERYRGRLVTVDVDICTVAPYRPDADNPAAVKQIDEIWALPAESSGWLYVGVIPDAPLGLTASVDKMTRARLTGYFFKLQGYHPQSAAPDAKAQRAPLIIGKVRLTQAPPAGPGRKVELYFGLQLMVLILICVGAVRLMILMRVRLSSTGRAERLARVRRDRRPDEDQAEFELPPGHEEDFKWVTDDAKEAEGR